MLLLLQRSGELGTRNAKDRLLNKYVFYSNMILGRIAIVGADELPMV